MLLPGSWWPYRQIKKSGIIAKQIVPGIKKRNIHFLLYPGTGCLERPLYCTSKLKIKYFKNCLIK